MVKKENKKNSKNKNEIVKREESIPVTIETSKKEIISIPNENKEIVMMPKKKKEIISTHINNNEVTTVPNENKEVIVISKEKKEVLKPQTKVDVQIKPVIINEEKSVVSTNKNESFDYKNKAEALLFSAGKRLEFEFIAQTINAKDKNDLKNALIELKKDYNDKNSSLMITEDGNSWKIVVKEKYVPIARKVNSEMELSKTIMETLAVIAWKTPILQSEVIRIRTNKAYDHIDELIASGFVTKEKKGRSFILKISQKFYDYFDVEGKDDIRQVFSKIKESPGQKKVDEFKHEPNSPQTTLGDLKIIDTKPDNSVKHAEEEMDKVRYGKLEVYDENNLESETKNKEKFSINDDEKIESETLEEIKKVESSEDEKLEKKTKDLVKKLLEEK